MKKYFYYVGFNANNSILNTDFFEGSITIYPTGEAGNIYYSNKLLNDTSSQEFFDNYKKYILNTFKKISLEKGNCTFMSFNDKIISLCSELPEVNFLRNNASELLKTINNKSKVKALLDNVVPTIKHRIITLDNLDYDKIATTIGSDSFVVQGMTGAGGNSTYFVSSSKDLERISDKKQRYSISCYMKHIPLNTTLIVGKKNTIQFPLSAQLISKNSGNFKYVGGDFVYPSMALSTNTFSEIYNYNSSIVNKLSKFGYRGILGVDYILTENNDVYFMEINPRLQSSTFLINQYLHNEYNLDVATLHYKALKNEILPCIHMKEEDIGKSFLNCNIHNSFDKYKNYALVNEGYFPPNSSSFYRKVFDSSIIDSGDFERCDILEERRNDGVEYTKRKRNTAFE